MRSLVLLRLLTWLTSIQIFRLGKVFSSRNSNPKQAPRQGGACGGTDDRFLSSVKQPCCREPSQTTKGDGLSHQAAPGAYCNQEPCGTTTTSSTANSLRPRGASGSPVSIRPPGTPSAPFRIAPRRT